jgi:hypothetical protein
MGGPGDFSVRTVTWEIWPWAAVDPMNWQNKPSNIPMPMLFITLEPLTIIPPLQEGPPFTGAKRRAVPLPGRPNPRAEPFTLFKPALLAVRCPGLEALRQSQKLAQALQ